MASTKKSYDEWKQTDEAGDRLLDHPAKHLRTPHPEVTMPDQEQTAIAERDALEHLLLTALENQCYECCCDSAADRQRIATTLTRALIQAGYNTTPER